MVGKNFYVMDNTNSNYEEDLNKNQLPRKLHPRSPNRSRARSLSRSLIRSPNKSLRSSPNRSSLRNIELRGNTEEYSSPLFRMKDYIEWCENHIRDNPKSVEAKSCVPILKALRTQSGGRRRRTRRTRRCN